MQQDWVNLAEHPTVEILLHVVAELQQRVLELEADMVTLKTEHDPWTSTIDVPADLWTSISRSP